MENGHADAQTTYTKKDIQVLIDWLDKSAVIVSNMGTPRADNNYGRAAQALATLIAPWEDDEDGALTPDLDAPI